MSRKEITCNNCGDGYFYIVSTLSLGQMEEKMTTFELLRCMACGSLQTERFDILEK
jgi:hypothetical protein